MESIKLKKLLKHYDDAYYNNDISLVSDVEYDTLRERYKELTGEYHDKDYVPGEAIKSRVAHGVKILSLDKAQIKDVEGLRKRIAPLLPVIIEPKFDGLTIVRYLEYFSTRGNGEVGEDVTQKCLQVPGLDKVVPLQHPIRMEILMLRSSFNRINKERIENGLDPFENPRNAAAGMLRNDDLSKIQGLTAFVYDELGNDLEHSRVLESLKLRYPELITPYQRFEDVDSAMEYIQNFSREGLDYNIDGLVIKSDQSSSMHRFGVTGHHPKNAFAVKFEAKGEWTEILDVIWQVGKETITPVAILKPVLIDGSTITRCTLHNFAQMEAIGLNTITSKTRVFVIKANDVIPKIIKVEQGEELRTGKSILPPAFCPSCKTPTTFNNDILICTNAECKGKLLKRITHMAGRDALDIVGLSEETAKKIMATYNISKPSDIFELTVEQIQALDGYAEKSAEKLYLSINKARNTTLDKAIYSASLPLIGRSVSKDIANELDLAVMVELFSEGPDIDSLRESVYTRIMSINGIGNEIANSFMNNLSMIKDAFKGLKIANAKANRIKLNATSVKSICITGTLEKPREYYAELIEKAGHKVAKSISSKTDAVLVGDKAGSKLAKANELGIKVITTEEELIEIIKF